MATTLSAGDIGFVQYNADGTDNFAFVLLVDIDADTEIKFTDHGWLAAGGFRATEGVLTWTPGAALSAGTVITLDASPAASIGSVSETGSLNFSGSGDQLIAFQGDVATPTPVAALNNEGAGVFQADATSSNTSALPTGLAAGASAVALTEIDNAVYTGATSGDAATLRAALFDPASWSGSNSANQTFSGAFTVSTGTPDVTAPTIAAASPADDATGVAVGEDVAITFSEPVVLIDPDSIELRRVSDDAVVAGGAAAVSAAGSVLTIDPPADLDPGEDYYVAIGAGALTDAAGNPFAGIADAATLNFTTAAAVPAPVNVIINEFLADPASGAAGDANGDGTRDSSDDEFVEIVNAGSAAVDLSGWTLSDAAVAGRHVFAAGTILAPGAAIVVFGGGAPTGAFGGAQVVTASGGALGLNNGGDTITLADADGAVQDQVVYGSEGGNNASLTRSPDLIGDFTDHAGIEPTPFSPGTTADGTAFADYDPADALAINEVRISSSSGVGAADFIEIFGIADYDLTGLTLVAISGEFAPGQIDGALSLDGFTTDADGFFLASDGSYASDPGDFTGGLTLFNSPQTIALVSGFTGAAGDDLDADDDGALDATPWDKIISAVSLIDGDGTPDFSYGGEVVGPAGSFVPGGAYAVEDGGDVWGQLGYSSDALDTPGFSNEPEFTALFIHEVQGAGDASAYEGASVQVEGVVSFLAPGLGGFFIQEEAADQDADAATSEGIFVVGDVSGFVVGDVLQVTGVVEEDFTNTQIAATSVVRIGAGVAPTAVTVEVRATETEAEAQARYEAVEGMLVEVVSGDEGLGLTVSENYQLGRYGEILVSSGPRWQPTQIFDAQTEAAERAELAELNLGNRLVIDDASSAQNPTTLVLMDDGLGNSVDVTDPAFAGFDAAGPTLRTGSELEPVVGVMQYAFSEYRVHVDAPVQVVEGTGARPTEVPEVGGDLLVASFNVLNFFTTIDGTGASGPNGLDPRGADTTSEYERQLDKLLAALTEMDADVIGLQELENNGFVDGAGAIDALVDALNAEMGAGTYAYVDPTADMGFIGTDAITTGIIYKPGAVSLLGADFLVFEEASADQTAADLGVTDLQRNRPTVAAAFEDAEGNAFTLAVSHFKSKGDSGLDAFDGSADPNVDQNDGQGYWNQARTDAAEELAAWLATDPFGTGSADSLIVGDLNAYAQEDPVQALLAAGYTDLAQELIGEDAYSYIFDGQLGTLDYGLASASLLDKVTGVAEWHINTNEPSVLDYDESFNDPAFYSLDAYRASDHDPFLIGLDLGGPDGTWYGADAFAQGAGRRAPGGIEQFVEEVSQGVATTTYFADRHFLSDISVMLSTSDAGGETAYGRVAANGIGVFTGGDYARYDENGVRLSYFERTARRDSVNGDEVLEIVLDAYGTGADSHEAVFEFKGEGEVRIQFLNDGAEVETVLRSVSGTEAFDFAPAEAFDEVHFSADEGMFTLSSFDFLREDAILF